MKKAFTLIELLIVICILGILIFVLFSAYNKISLISFRIEQQRKVNEELLFLSETLQNFANRNSIDFEKYSDSLPSSSGFTDILYLSGEDGRFSIYASGNCANLNTIPEPEQLSSGCFFSLRNEDNGKEIRLTNESVYFTKAKFKIIPYSNNYFAPSETATQCDTNYFACVNDDGFWVFTDAYPTFFNKAMRSYNIHVFVQHFFNI